MRLRRTRYPRREAHNAACQHRHRVACHLSAMLVDPFLPSWLWEGPRPVKHHPRRHICGDCGTSWADDHVCATEPAPSNQPLRGQLRRTRTPTALERRSSRTSSRPAPSNTSVVSGTIVPSVMGADANPAALLVLLLGTVAGPRPQEDDRGGGLIDSTVAQSTYSSASDVSRSPSSRTRSPFATQRTATGRSCFHPANGPRSLAGFATASSTGRVNSSDHRKTLETYLVREWDAARTRQQVASSIIRSPHRHGRPDVVGRVLPLLYPHREPDPTQRRVRPCPPTPVMLNPGPASVAHRTCGRSCANAGAPSGPQ